MPVVHTQDRTCTHDHAHTSTHAHTHTYTRTLTPLPPTPTRLHTHTYTHTYKVCSNVQPCTHSDELLTTGPVQVFHTCTYTVRDRILCLLVQDFSLACPPIRSQKESCKQIADLAEIR